MSCELPSQPVLAALDGQAHEPAKRFAGHRPIAIDVLQDFFQSDDALGWPVIGPFQFVERLADMLDHRRVGQGGGVIDLSEAAANRRHAIWSSDRVGRVDHT